MKQIAMVMAIAFLVLSGQGHSANDTPTPQPASDVVFDQGVLSGVIRILASPQSGQDASTSYSTDPTSLSSVLQGARYAEVIGPVNKAPSWHFRRNPNAIGRLAIVTFGANTKRNTQLLALGVPQGALLAPPKGGHTSSGGDLPPGGVSATPSTNSVAVPYLCGTCQTWYVSHIDDMAYYDPQWIKLNEGKINVNCTASALGFSNCHGWWWAYWADDGWQLNSSWYTGPYQVGSQMWNSGGLTFEPPWFCLGQPTYVYYNPNQVRLNLDGSSINSSWNDAEGPCTFLLTEVTYS